MSKHGICDIRVAKVVIFHAKGICCAVAESGVK